MLWTPSISSLFRPRSPAHVAGFVVSKGVDSINRVICRRWVTNVIVEGSKAISPFREYRNSSPSINRVTKAIRIVATLADSGPSVKNLGSSFAMFKVGNNRGFAHSCKAKARYFRVPATTRMSVIAGEIPGLYPGFFSAITKAFPVDLSLMRAFPSGWEIHTFMRADN